MIVSIGIAIGKVKPIILELAFMLVYYDFNTLTIKLR